MEFDHCHQNTFKVFKVVLSSVENFFFFFYFIQIYTLNCPYLTAPLRGWLSDSDHESIQQELGGAGLFKGVQNQISYHYTANFMAKEKNYVHSEPSIGLNHLPPLLWPAALSSALTHGHESSVKVQDVGNSQHAMVEDTVLRTKQKMTCS